MRPKDKNVTIYDIAKQAGASASTVGAVMNGTWRSRRISETRAKAIQAIADEMGYSRNMQASGLRRDRSRIIGMIVPMYNNRYFSSIAQRFEREARARNLFPMVSCTRRDPHLEQETVLQMLDYRVEQIVCTGTTDPDAVADLCKKRGVPTINLDLPGSQGPSIISDNYQGAYQMTKGLIDGLSEKGQPIEQNILFVGGRPNEHNTSERVRGFVDAHLHAGADAPDKMLLTCGYASINAVNVLNTFKETEDTFPRSIFVNSTESLEGVLNWVRSQKDLNLEDLKFGCFDWDPFATFITSDVLMVRQNVDEMIRVLFELIDDESRSDTTFIEVPPTVISHE